jgi:hypothetical protein
MEQLALEKMTGGRILKSTLSGYVCASLTDATQVSDTVSDSIGTTTVGST